MTLVLGLTAMPFSYLATAPAWNGVGGELEEAARVHGVRPARRAWLSAKLLTPAIAAALAVSFAESLGDFGVASTLAANAHFPVATFAIYRALYANPLDFPLASATSWLLLLVTGVALLLQAGVARALAGRPGVLLFDEPLSNLDAQLREELRLEIARLTREHGITSVYITHDQAEAFFLAGQLGVMRAGRLLQFGPPEQIYTVPATPFVAQFTGALGHLEAELRGSLLCRGPLRIELPGDFLPQGRVRVALRPEALIRIPKSSCAFHELFRADASGKSMRILRGGATAGVVPDGAQQSEIRMTVHRTFQPGALEATPLHCAYGGGYFQVWLSLAGGERLLAHSPARLPEGAQVWLTLDPR